MSQVNTSPQIEVNDLENEEYEYKDKIIRAKKNESNTMLKQ